MVGLAAAQYRGSQSPSHEKSEKSVAATKRKPDSEISPKRDHKTAKQTTIEETMRTKHGDTELKDTDADFVKANAVDSDTDKKVTREAANTSATNRNKPIVTADDTITQSVATGDDAIKISHQRESKIASNILEKGIIYFITRNRVGIEDSSSVGDLQRTFFVLRPIPIGAKLGDGTPPDNDNNRLFALPKKVFPKSHNDKYMAFVQKSKSSIKDLKEHFFAASEYDTKTKGLRRDEPVTPIAEGVYAISQTEDLTTHLVYSTTIPSEMGEVQQDLGLKDRGSFIISVKNPERSGPASAQLPQKPEFPKEIVAEFRNLAWSAVKPKYLDYEYCQILLIGEKVESAIEPIKKDQKHQKDTPQEELEKLEHEDELRIQHLHGDDSVFDDLQISKQGYTKVPTTW